MYNRTLSEKHGVDNPANYLQRCKTVFRKRSNNWQGVPILHQGYILEPSQNIVHYLDKQKQFHLL
jgi:hypothetical protein